MIESGCYRSLFNEVINMITEKKYDFLKKRMNRQTKEIENLSHKIYQLKIENNEKQDLIDSINSIKKDWKESLDTICVQRDEYQKLIFELRAMKTVMKTTVFKGKWKLIKLLMK